MKPFSRVISLGLIAIFVIVIAASFILSLILRFTSLPENSLQWVILAISFIALFIGGFIAGGKGKESGWLIGGLTGLSYTIIIFIIQYLGFDSPFDAKQYLYHAAYILTAVIGGILGVNFSGNRG